VDGLTEAFVSLALYLLFFSACVAFGATALTGSVILLIRSVVSRRLERSCGAVTGLVLLVVIGGVVLTALFLSYERMPGVYFLVAPPVGLMLCFVALVLCVRAARFGRPWKAEAFLASAGCLILYVPTALILWYGLSYLAEQAIDKRQQAELVRGFPSETVYVPDTDTMPRGTEEGPYFNASPYDGRKQIEQTYHPPEETSGYDPDQVHTIRLVQRPNAKDLVRRCDEYAPGSELPSCEVVAVTPEGREIRLKYPSGGIPKDPLTHGYYFVAMGDDAVEIEVYTDSSHAGRPEDFDLLRFVDGLKPVPKEEFLEDPPEGTYWE
jgi:hypothetical protein